MKQIFKIFHKSTSLNQLTRLQPNNSNNQSQKYNDDNFVIRKIKIPHIYGFFNGHDQFVVSQIYVKKGDTLYDRQALLEFQSNSTQTTLEKLQYHYFLGEFSFWDKALEVTKVNVEVGKSYPYGHTAFQAKFYKNNIYKLRFSQNGFLRRFNISEQSHYFRFWWLYLLAYTSIIIIFAIVGLFIKYKGF